MSWYDRISFHANFLIVLAILTLFVFILLGMGRVPVCECGYVKLWHGTVFSSENSQHITDWYTFSHIIHGFGFYFLFWLIGRRWGWSIGSRFLFALALETGWEILENTDWIINYYRANTISLDYYGDSVINSVGDVLFMALGFWLTARLPVWATVALTIFMELLVLYFIRDNLTLNILMFIYPWEAILRWQGGG